MLCVPVRLWMEAPLIPVVNVPNIRHPEDPWMVQNCTQSFYKNELSKKLKLKIKIIVKFNKYIL